MNFPPKISPEQKISLENELEQRILAIRNARRFIIGEEDKKRSERIEIVSYGLEDFCTGYLLGLKEKNK